MANTTSEAPISSGIPPGGRTLLADITYSTVWSDNTLQYYLGNSSTLTFTQEFRDSYNTRYDSNSNPDQNFAYVAQAVRSYQVIDNVIATDFTRLTNAAQAQASADLVLVTSSQSLTGTLEGYHMLPGGVQRAPGDFWGLGVFSSNLSTLNVGPETGGGEYLYWTLIHEIGHGIGLLHPFDGTGTTLPSIGAALDNERYTVMSYNGATQADAFGHAVTMMALDIAALQAQYGAETYANANSTYTLRDAQDGALSLAENSWQIGRAYASIWDSGGTDTIRYGSTGNAVLINLNDATLDRSGVASDAAPSIAALQNTQRFATLSADIRQETIDPDFHAGGFFSRVITSNGAGLDGGYTIAHGARIENATGGAGADILIGNELGNRLLGAAGDDVLIGGRGNDTLQGGAGNDTAAYAGASSQYTITDTGNGNFTIANGAGAEGTDSLSGVEFAQFSDTRINLTQAGGGPGVNLTGTAAANALTGTSGDDTLTGLGGNDTLTGLGADDRLDGGTGNDLLFGEGTASSGPRLPMGNGFADFGRTVAVPGAIRQGYVAVQMDAGFSLAQDGDIANSTTIPHLTAGYNITNSGFVFLAFDIVAGERLVIDVDYAADANGNFDSFLRLFDSSGNQVATNDDATASTVGAGGSILRLDSYLDITLQQTGTYFAEIGQFGGQPIPTNQQFEVNVSLDFPQTGTGGGGGGIQSAGNDTLIGGAGNDTLRGGDGSDTLNGGDGDDFIYGGETSADLRDVIFAGAGHDSVDAGYGNDSINGDAGNDTIEGGFGVDTVVGGDGDDVLTGSAWSDAIFGGNGNDFINGGFGFDRVNGGAGADRFFHIGVLGHGSDWIQDYTAVQDDVLQTGIAGSSASDYQVNYADTPNAGVAGVSEAFVIYIPTRQILWALVDGGGESEINLQIGGNIFDLTA